jgi:PAS domain S-box-containing protein
MTIVLSAIAITVLLAVLSVPYIRRYQLRRFAAAIDVISSSIKMPVLRMPAIHPFVSTVQDLMQRLRAGKSRRPAFGCELASRQGGLPMGAPASISPMLSSLHLVRADVRTEPHPQAERRGTFTSAEVSSGSGERRHGAPSLGTLALLPVAALMTDEDGLIVSANTVAETLFGYYRDEMCGVSWNALIPSLPTHGSPVSYATGGRGSALITLSGGLDVAARRKDGNQFPVEITTIPVRWDDKAHSLTVVVDRTERYELQRHRQQLAHLTRVSTLGELAGSLAHELNVSGP